MKKIWIVIFVLVALVLVMKVTVPPIEKHYVVATEQPAMFLEDKVIEGDEFDEILEDYGIDKAVAMQYLQQEEVYKSVLKFMVESMLFLEDYFVCNVGKFTYEGEVYPLTLGMFGHVFVLTDYYDEIKDTYEKYETISNQ